MSRHTHVFGWDEEPSDERPSEFRSSSGHSAFAGQYVPRDLSERMARRHGVGIGFLGMVAAAVGLLVLSGLAIREFVGLLHL